MATLPSDTPNSTSSPRSQARTVDEVRSNAFSLHDFDASFALRRQAILDAAASSGDVIFTSTANTSIKTYGALFSIAASARGRPAIPVEKYARREGDADGVLRDDDAPPPPQTNLSGASKDVKCSDKDFVQVAKVHELIAAKLEEHLDRLLDECLKEVIMGDGTEPVAPDFTIMLEKDEEEEDSGVAIERTSERTDNKGKRPEKPASPHVRNTTRRSAPTSAGTRGPTAASRTSRRPPATSRNSTTRTVPSGRPAANIARKPSVPPAEKQTLPPIDSLSISETPVDSPQEEVQTTTPPQPTHIKVHRLVAAASIPYYKYLTLTHVSFADSASPKSTLPAPTITTFALRFLQHWLYNPHRIANLLDSYHPDAHLYIISPCKRLLSKSKQTAFPPPTAIARGIIQVARAADYLGITELSGWCHKILVKLCHGIDKCTGIQCRAMVPFILQEIYNSDGGLGIPDRLTEDIIDFIAENVEGMWRKPLIMLSDELLEAVLAAFMESNRLVYGSLEGHRRKLRQSATAMVGGSVGAGEGSGSQSGQTPPRPPGNENVVKWWYTFIELSKVRSSVHAATAANTKRWDEKLLGPAIEFCVHQLAHGFEDERLKLELQSKIESGSFDRSLVDDLLGLVTMHNLRDRGLDGYGASPAPGMAAAIPFDKAPLTRKTVRSVFEGIVNLRTWDGYMGSWGDAEKRIIDFLKREWQTIAAGLDTPSGKSGFRGWRPAMVQVVSRKLRVSVDELLGNEKAVVRQTPMRAAKPGRDWLGNDIFIPDEE